MSAAHDAAGPVLPEVGTVLDGRFELLGTLGEGGMGHVFRAHDRRLGREVALKLITPRYLGRPERELRLLRELELGRRAEHHRSLIEVVDGGRLRDLDWPFLVTELVHGKDLASRLARGPLPPPEATRLARQVAGAVLALHRAGIVHRDVTSMNVLVTEGGDAVLIDLSHACEVAAPQVSPGEQQRLTRENEVPGTDHFMAPEQARAEPAQPAMDVYAFGVMLVHMLTGVAPGQCGREAFIELQREGRLRPPRIDTRVYTEVPLALAELVDACVAEEAGRRPAMDEVVRRLDEQLVVMTASLETDGSVVAANEAGGSVLVGAAVPVAEPRLSWRSWWIGFAAVGVLVMLGAVAWLGSRELGDGPPAEASMAAEFDGVAVDESSPSFERSGSSDPAAAPVPADLSGAEPAEWTVPAEDSGEPAAALVPIEHPGAEPAAVPTPAEGSRAEPAEDAVTPEAAESNTPTETDTIETSELSTEAEPDGPVGARTSPTTGTSEPTDAKPKQPKHSRRSRRAPASEDPTVPHLDPCDEIATKAEAARSARHWSEVDRLTSQPRCWDDPVARGRLRIKALSELGRYGECMTLGGSSNDPETKRLAAHCARRLEEAP